MSSPEAAPESPFQEAELLKESERIEGLLAEIRQLASPRVRELAQELLQCVLDYHGGALDRIAGAAGEESVRAWAEDPLVSSVLLLHGLHPLGVEERVRRALERVRPALKAHGGDAELLSVADGKATVRLTGACRGCPSSAATLKNGVEAAILAEAPEIAEVALEESCPA